MDAINKNINYQIIKSEDKITLIKEKGLAKKELFMGIYNLFLPFVFIFLLDTYKTKEIATFKLVFILITVFLGFMATSYFFIAEAKRELIIDLKNKTLIN